MYTLLFVMLREELMLSHVVSQLQRIAYSPSIFREAEGSEIARLQTKKS